jgi:hypothetical protein
MAVAAIVEGDSIETEIAENQKFRFRSTRPITMMPFGP